MADEATVECTPDRIMVVTLNRPHARNAVTAAVSDLAAAAVDGFDAGSSGTSPRCRSTRRAPAGSRSSNPCSRPKTPARAHGPSRNAARPHGAHLAYFEFNI